MTKAPDAENLFFLNQKQHHTFFSLEIENMQKVTLNQYSEQCYQIYLELASYFN